jgi:hypothetical protein
VSKNITPSHTSIREPKFCPQNVIRGAQMRWQRVLSRFLHSDVGSQNSSCLCQRLPGRRRASASPCRAPPAAGSARSGDSDCGSGPPPPHATCSPAASSPPWPPAASASRQRARWVPGTDCMEDVAVSNCQCHDCIAQHGLYAVY